MLWVASLTLLAALLALALDAGNLVQSGTNFQNAADAAAISAATATRQSSTLAQATTAATTAAEQVAQQAYGITGNWGTCTPPTGFTPNDPGDNCVAFDQYNLEATAVGTAVATITLSAPSNAAFGQPIVVDSTLSGLGTGAGGTITFSVIRTDINQAPLCTGSTAAGTAPVTGNGTYTNPAPGYIPTQTGYYWWQASYGGDANNAPVSTGCTEETVVGSGTPALTLSVPDAAPAGAPLPAGEISAVLSGASNPLSSDTITFDLYGPYLIATPPDCFTEVPAWTGSAAVTGNGPFSPGPTPALPALSQGNYWWYASFSGDTNNTPANSGCGPPLETVVPASGSPVLGISAPNYDTVGTVIPASAINGVLSGTTGATTGDTIIFDVFGPLGSAPVDCTTGGTQVGNSVPVSGDNTYNPTAGFTPTQVGEYWWYAYTTGDANNLPVNSGCQQLEMTVGLSVPTITVSAPSIGTDGTLITAADIAATLSSSSAGPPTGDITFSVFGPDAAPPTCTSGGAQVGLAVAVNGVNTYNPTAGFTPTQPGKYWWYASYTGDAKNLPSNSACGAAETTVGLTVPTVTVSAPNSDSTNTPIASANIVASLSGTSGSPAGGTITFWLYGPGARPSTCSGAGWTQLDAVPVSGDASYPSSAGFTPTQEGEYWWYAVYSGDTDNSPANSACATVETVVETAENLSMAAPSTGTVGAAISATATLSGPSTGIVGGNPQTACGGAPRCITFWVYGPGAEPTSCPGAPGTSWAQVGVPVGVTGYGSYPSDSFTPSAPGNYWWYAWYSGDGNDLPTDSGCGVAIWVQIPTQNVATLFGIGGGGGTFSRTAYAFGATTGDASQAYPGKGKLCFFPGTCNAAS